jgi:hypothetical protein
MTVKRCKKCDRDMGYNSEQFELCAPCELGYTNDKEEKQSSDEPRVDSVTAR